MRRVVVVLVHHPVVDRAGAVVTTAITNLDLHDIARSAHSFGLSDYFVTHPVAAQRELASRVRHHWVEGSGARRIPDRRPAMERLRVVASIEDVLAALGGPVELWTTSATAGRPVVSHAAARRLLEQPGPTVALLFGTGWGLAPELLERATLQLAPIASPRADGYNHLSVRAAAAITFDRLLAPAAAEADG